MGKQQLKVQIENGLLSISIGVDILCHSADHGIADQGLRIADKDRFLDELKMQLMSGANDGTTVVHKLFDACAMDIAELDDCVGEIEDRECFLCGADDSGIELHEYDSPKISQMELVCSECLTNGDADDY